MLKLPANRVAVIAHVAACVATLIASLAQVFPHSWQNATAAAVALLAQVPVVLKFLTGSQAYDQILHEHPPPSPPAGVPIVDSDPA